MIVPVKETCQECGDEYWQGCLRDGQLLCDKCRGIPESVDKSKIETEKEWIAEVHRQIENRYGPLKDA